MKKIKFILAIIVITIGCYITYRLWASGITDELASQRMILENKKNELVDLKKQLQDVYAQLENAIGVQINQVIHQQLLPIRDQLSNSQSQLNQIPDQVLRVFDPQGKTGLADTKNLINVALDVINRTYQLLHTDIKDSILLLVQPLNPASANSKPIYEGLDQSVKLLESASHDIEEMIALINEVLK